ncbi:MAG TPA: NADH-quinone oxidoreductase subunit NuoE [Gammaproteobacteria bacterium]|nr:NADH-quinone oxidoreductase subunit NuoE [Gammaproteobacteria bacterium]
MLTEVEKREIEEERGHYPDNRAVSVEALKIVQRARGWVSDDSLADVADYLGLSTAEVESVATFYSLIYRQPVGRHVIHACDSISCWIMGYGDMCETLKQKLGVGLGGTTADGRFTLLPIPCLGNCDHAPAVMIDEDLHNDVTADNVDAILERYD